MEFMSLAGLVQYGTPVLLLGLIVSNVWSITTIRNMSRAIDHIREDVVWKDNYVSLEDRVKRLENKENGK